MKELRFYKKNVYGVERVYPVPEIKKAINALTGRSTLENRHLQSLVELGFSVLVDEGKFTVSYL